MAVSSGVTLFERVRYWRAYQQELPEGALPLPSVAESAPMDEQLLGSTLALAAGDPGKNALTTQLTLTANNRLADQIASCVLVLSDATQLRAFQASLPPEFAGRIQYASIPDFAGGHANRSVAETLATIAEWGPPVVRATENAIYQQLANGARAPGLVTVHGSLGGHAVTLLPALKLVRDRFPAAVIVIDLPVPRFDLQRKRWLEIKPLFDEVCGVDAWLLRDNLAHGSLTDLDFASVALQVGLAEAAAHEEQAINPVNAFALATGNRRGAVLIYQVVRSFLASEPWPPPPRRPVRFFVKQSPLVVQLERMLAALAEGRGQWSVDVPPSYTRGATFDVLLANIRRRDLLGVTDELRAALDLRGAYRTPRVRKGAAPAHGAANYGLVVASTTARIDPARPVCPLVGVRFTQARDAGDLTEALAKVPEKRRFPARPSRTLERNATPTKQLPAPSASLATGAGAKEVTREHL